MRHLVLIALILNPSALQANLKVSSILRSWVPLLTVVTKV